MESFLVISSVLLWVVVGFNLLLTLALVRRANNSIKSETGEYDRVLLETLKSGDIAPPFLATTLEGVDVTLDTYAGQSIILIFVTSGCKSCKEKIPEIEKISSNALAAGIKFVFVCLDNMDTAIAYFNEFNTTSSVLVAPASSNSFATNYKIPGTPYFCLIDEQGIIQDAGFFDSKWYSRVLQWFGGQEATEANSSKQHRK